MTVYICYKLVSCQNLHQLDVATQPYLSSHICPGSGFVWCITSG